MYLECYTPFNLATTLKELKIASGELVGVKWCDTKTSGIIDVWLSQWEMIQYNLIQNQAPVQNLKEIHTSTASHGVLRIRRQRLKHCNGHFWKSMLTCLQNAKLSALEYNGQLIIIEFYNNIRVGFIENTTYPVFSFSRLWENPFISSSLYKTNLPATAIILNWKRRKKPTLFNAAKCGNRDVIARHNTRKYATRIPDGVARLALNNIGWGGFSDQRLGLGLGVLWGLLSYCGRRKLFHPSVI